MESKTPEEKSNIIIAVYHTYFSYCMSDFCSLLMNKSVEIINNKRQSGNLNENTGFYKSHIRLQKTCQSYKDMFESVTVDENGGTGKFIKKVFKNLTSNLTLLHPEPNNMLFKMKKDNMVVTIIPGLDIGILIDEFNEKETELFWAYIYFLLISSTQLLSATNTSKRIDAVKEIMPLLHEKVKKSGIIEFGRLNNPYVGLNFESNETLDIETMMKGIGDIKSSEGFLSFIEEQLNKVIDMEAIKTQLDNIGDEEIKSVKEHLNKMFDNDPNIAGIADRLPEIINDIKETRSSSGGKIGIRELADSLRNHVDNMDIKLDPSTITTTTAKLDEFLTKSRNDIAEMKDENGNPVGEKLLETIQAPLKLLHGLQSGTMDKRQAKKLKKQMKKAMKEIN